MEQTPYNFFVRVDDGFSDTRTIVLNYFNFLERNNLLERLKEEAPDSYEWWMQNRPKIIQALNQ